VINTAPLIRFGESISPRRQCCLLANLNSFVLDFVARQKIGGIHLNYFILEQLPLLPPDRYADRCLWNKRQTLEKWISDRVLKLSCTADDMRPFAKVAEFDPPVHRWNPTERAELMTELDAAFFLLYGISRVNAEYILSTFQGTSRPDESTGELFQTDISILDAYDRLSQKT